MNKTIVLCLMIIFFAAAAEARYVRKLIEPDFFIPADDRMHKPEKLPPVQKTVSKDSAGEEKAKLTDIPEYKKKYSRYLADMAVFANSKSFPVNEAFDADMAVFTDGKIFEVTETADQNITTREQKSFYSLVDSIVKN